MSVLTVKDSSCEQEQQDMGQSMSGHPSDHTVYSGGDISRLDRSLASGVAWTAAAKWSTQVLSWASLIAIAHLLSPSDFGLVGMAAIYLGLITIISEFGVGTAVLTLRDLTNEQVAQLNSVSVIFGLAGFGISCAIAGPLGKFFRAPKLPIVVIAMSATFVIMALRSVPYGLLQKEMRFRLLSVLETCQAMFQAAATLLFAFLGYGYWALVIGNIAGVALLTGLTAIYKRHGFAKPRFAAIRRALKFSWQLLVQRLCWYGYSNADFLIAGRVLGVSPLGEYSFAWNLATAPVEKVAAVVTNVTPSFFSAMQDEKVALRRYLRVLTEGMSILIFPATFGMALVAHEFVPLVLGSKWNGMIVPLQLLALFASLRSIVPLLPQILVVVGETEFGMWNGIATIIVMPTAFYIGSRWGITGIATAWLFTYPLMVIPLYYRTFTKIHLKLSEYLRGLYPPLNGSIGMAIVVGSLKWWMGTSLPLYLRLALEITAGAITYGAVMFLFYGDRMLGLWQLVNGLLRKETP